MTKALTFPNLEHVPATPFYLYSEQTLLTTLQKIQSVIPSYVDMHFALKANHNPKVLSVFRAHGLGIDIVSGGELEYALDVGFKGKQVVFSGVGKSEDELELAISHDVGLINIESIFELNDVVRIARRLGRRARVGFRLNPDVDAKTHPYIATGLQAHKFGISFEQAQSMIKDLLNVQDAVNVCGLSMHIGSQILDLSAIREAALKLLNEAKLWRKSFDSLDILDLGGGLGISYQDPLSMADFDSYAKILFEVGEQWQAIAGIQARLALELGRSLVASSGFLFTRVIGVKENRGSHFAVVDASMTELMRPSLYQAYHEIVPHQSKIHVKIEPATHEMYDIVGPVCESSDVLGRQRKLPRLHTGNVLIICSAGAYGYVLSNVYNMRRLPAEYWLDKNGNLEMVRRSIEWKEINQMLLCNKGERVL